MSGSKIRNIVLIIKLILLFLIFLYLNKNMFIDVKSFYLYNFIALLGTIFTFFYCFFLNSIEFRKNKENDRTLKKISKLEFKKTKNFPIYYNNDIFKDYILEFLDELNEDQKEMFVNKGYIIVIGTKSELKYISRIKNINGLFSHYEKYILLYIDDKTSKEHFKSTFFHEWGHFVDYYNHYISDTFIFKKLYFDEKIRIYSTIKLIYSNNLEFYYRHNKNASIYELTNSSEYFAVNYSKYKRKTLNNKNLINIFDKIEKVA